MGFLLWMLVLDPVAVLEGRASQHDVPQIVCQSGQAWAAQNLQPRCLQLWVTLSICPMGPNYFFLHVPKGKRLESTASRKGPGATPGRRGWILFIPLSLVPPWTESLENCSSWCLLSEPAQRQEFGRSGMCWTAPSAGNNVKGSLGKDLRQRRPNKVLASLTVQWADQTNPRPGNIVPWGTMLTTHHKVLNMLSWGLRTELEKNKVKIAKIRGQPRSCAEKSSLKEGQERSLYFSKFIYRLS